MKINYNIKQITNISTSLKIGSRRISFKALLYVFIALFIFGSIPTLTFNQNVSAQGGCDEQYYSSNDILFYDPCETTCSSGAGGGTLTGQAPSALTGANNEEKAWNYFAARGLTPVAAAGAMGNIKAESSFSASVEEASGGGGLGIIQWTGPRRTSLENAAAAAGVNLADNDSALLFELNYLWDGEYNAMTWQNEVNAETKVEGDTTIASFAPGYSDKLADSQAGNGSTMVFHALVERSGDVPTEADSTSGRGVLTHRIDNAKAYLEQFGGGTGAGSCSVSAEGLTWEQAVAAAKKLSDDWTGVFCGAGSIKEGFYCDWVEGYCTAGAAWMAQVTASDPSSVPPIPNGVDVANRLVSFNVGGAYTIAKPDGSNLQPFSVWSFGDGSADGQPGHTGTIVNVGKDGSLITLETNWGGKTAGSTKDFIINSGHRVAVFEYPSFEAFKNSHNGYVYNATATPKDSATATLMAKKMTAFASEGK
jgi:hypothetical protein